MNNKQPSNRSRQRQDSYRMIQQTFIGMFVISIFYYGLNELGLINPIIEGVNFVIKNIKLLF